MDDINPQPLPLLEKPKGEGITVIYLICCPNLPERHQIRWACEGTVGAHQLVVADELTKDLAVGGLAVWHHGHQNRCLLLLLRNLRGHRRHRVVHLAGAVTLRRALTISLGVTDIEKMT